MHFQVFTDYPAWFWLLCIVCGGAYAAGLYYRERKIQSAITSATGRRLLAATRFFAVALLAFLLLNPYLKSRFNQTDKPIIILAMDNSASMLQQSGDSSTYMNLMAGLHSTFSGNYDVRTYTFGESLKEGAAGMNFTEKNTDISSALNELNNLYENLNVGGIILISDGIYNTGSNPVYVKNELGAPIYTIPTGDTIPKKDIRIARSLHNNIVYLKDKFVITTDVEAVFCKGSNTTISVVEIAKGKSTPLGEKNISVNEDNFSTSFDWEITADAPGIRHYQIRITKIDGESTTDNNIEDIYIEVLDARQKILLLANSPHPDINALKQCIESNQNYQIDIQLAADFKGNVADYDLVILHQLPSLQNPVTGVLSGIKSAQTPVFFITGAQTALNSFNNAQSLVKIVSGGQSANEVTSVSVPGFNLFTLDEKTLATFPKLPALGAPYGQYTVSPATQVLFNQKIGSVGTKNPLLVYSLPGGEKTAVLCGENFWKWRLYDYVINTHQDATNELISKTVQYLAAKNDKKQFRVSQAKNVLNENEEIILDGELYNDSYELINEPDATLTIKNEDGKEFPFQFSKTTDRYQLNAGYFPVGNYTYSAHVSFNGKEYNDNGAFSISPVRLETINTTANHRLLNQLAVQSGGKMVYPANASTLKDLIANSAAAKPVLHEITKTQSIIHLKWIFFVLLGLLGLEWFIRKYSGGY